jgi:phage recombination protein Bet
MATTTAAVKEKPEKELSPQAQQALANRKSPLVAVKSVLLDMADRYGMEPAAFEATLRHTIIPKDCSREQFAAFLLVAKEYDLNPLLKEIYAFPAKGGGIQPIVGVDGWSNLINSHPAFDGMDFEDRLDSGGNLLAIACRIYRKDRSHAAEATEYMAECKRNTEPWTKWPRRMLRHKAMIQAARYAFGFAGIIDPDEAERFAGEAARDVTPRRLASTTAAFEEFSKGGAPVDAEAGEAEGDAPATELDGEFADDAPQPDQAQQKVEQQPQPAEGKNAPAQKPAGEPEGQPPRQEPEKQPDKPSEPAQQAAWPKDQVPKTPEEYERYAKAHIASLTTANAVGSWFKSEDQRKLRNACSVTKDTFDAVKAVAQSRITELTG